VIRKHDGGDGGGVVADEVTCPNCGASGSQSIVIIYEDPVTYRCNKCGEVFGE